MRFFEKINSDQTRKLFLRVVVFLVVVYLFIYFTLPLFGLPIATEVLTVLYNMFIAIAITSALAEARVSGVMPIVESSINRMRGRSKAKQNAEKEDREHEIGVEVESADTSESNKPSSVAGVNLYTKYKERFVGLTEFEGLKHNPRIIEIFKQLGWYDYYQMKRDEDSWCASLPALILRLEGIAKSVTRPTAAAKSFLKVGKEISVETAESVLNNSEEDFLMVAVFHSPNRGPNAGHVIMIESITDGIASYGAGNESNQFREGKRSLKRPDLAGIRYISKSNF